MSTWTGVRGSALVDLLDGTAGTAPVTLLRLPPGVAGVPAGPARAGPTALVGAWPDPAGEAFGVFRPLLSALLPELLAEQPDVVTESRAELAALVDGLPPGPRLEDVMQLQVGLARMVPRESELAFRVAARVAWVVQRAAEGRVRRGARPPLLVLPGIDVADRPSLVVTHQLCRRARLGAFRLVLVPSGGGTAPVPAAGELPVDAGSGDRARRGLFAEVLAAAGAEVVEAAEIEPEPVATAAAAAADAGRPDPDRWRAAVADGTRWFTPETVLDLVAAAPAGVPLTERALAAGIAYATVGDYPNARVCFARGREATDEPVARARMSMFLALVAAKRTADFPEAEADLAAGFAAVAGLPGPDADLERGWLMNLQALVAYRQGRRDVAVELTRSALRMLRPHRTPEAVGLKTNLLANLSIVHETSGRPRAAVTVWAAFTGLLERGGDVYDKYFHYRAAGLQVALDPVAAAEGYERVARLAERLGDLVALEAALTALTRLAADRGDPAAAAGWAQRLPGVRERLGDLDGLVPAWRAVAACRAAAGDAAGAADAGREVARLAGQPTGGPAPGDGLPAMPGTMLRQPAGVFLP